MLGPNDYWKSGDYNALCDRCGEKYKASDLRLEWDGLRVCGRCFEFRQPQDFVRGVADQQAPPWTRPVPEEEFVLVCTLQGISAIPGYSIPGCMTPSLIPGGLFP